MQKILELTEAELPVSFYQLVHVEDAVCLAEAHKEGGVYMKFPFLLYEISFSDQKWLFRTIDLSYDQ